ncbi:hypothetical protein F4810DRAFT_257613 [Camillea tinctor]|nr:hypothetical protein F4810DRAFT_257613 [Camillea tinctor]
MATPKEKPIVVGLYGVPGSGKTYLLQHLQKELCLEEIKFYEGSEVIVSLTTGGLDAFRRLDEQEKLRIRQLAISRIRQECLDNRCAAVVTGHFMFWPEGQVSGEPVYTQKDLEIYTHILYLDVPASEVRKQRQNDTSRSRPALSIEHLEKWQAEEKAQIRRLCYSNRILFSVVSPPFLDRVQELIRDFCRHTEQRNINLAKEKLDSLLPSASSSLETILIMDGDKTLSAEDTGSMFWSMCRKSGATEECPLKRLFSSPMEYSHTAFRQASLLYEDRNSGEGDYEDVCEEVATKASIYPEFLLLLKQIEVQQHVQ